MKQYLKVDEWKIIEEGFHREYNRISESVFSIGNGKMGQRADFEETYSGDSLQGSYIAGVYYPDKTKVGWWKNGYPEYFAKVLNAANWIGIDVYFEGTELDLAYAELQDFSRVLDMKRGRLERSFHATLPTGPELSVNSRRFCSIVDTDLGAIRYSIKVAQKGQLQLLPYIDGDVMNEDSNYDEKFWEEIETQDKGESAWVNSRTKKTGFEVCTAMRCQLYLNGKPISPEAESIVKQQYVGHRYTLDLEAGDEIVLYKFAANCSTLYYPSEQLTSVCQERLQSALDKGYAQMEAEQEKAWAAKWEDSDITIEGDPAAQQGIRFNIFQLNQTYTGEDERLNIGPKGFTGEKYGGSTYWDTEAYCLPFYLSTSDSDVARQLLIYRHKHLPKAIENAEKLGFSGGAALYPMVTMNGEECHNEWEITFEEIHRNGAIAYAVYDYIRYTGDQKYLAEYGLEVLIGISRFWAQRVNWSEAKQQYVMLGVTGPNEYENNVNNNWYTNYIAAWCLAYTRESIEWVQKAHPEAWSRIAEAVSFADTELSHWTRISANMYYPQDEKRGVVLQQQGFLDKEIIRVADLDKKHLPLNQNWSWDRILRSCFIKQADVLQGFYFFEDHFSEEEHRRNFEFYEPLTVHESSLSPCVHVILAAKLGMQHKAYEMYLRTARLDLDDYNNDTEDGCHITSMAGTWMAVVKGFGGLRVRDGKLHLAPFVPEKWQSFSFKIRFRGANIEVQAGKAGTEISNHSQRDLQIVLHGQELNIPAGGKTPVLA